MEIAIVLKCLCWSFLLLWLNEKVLYTTAASVIVDQPLVWQKFNREHYFMKHFKREVESQQQAAASSQTFLELILGIIDTLQFGKRKIGATAQII